MEKSEIKNVKVNDVIYYEGTKVKVSHIDEHRISFTGLDNPNDSCGNIPLYERRPGNSKTNIELLSKKL